MDIETVRKYIYIYKVIQIIVEYSLVDIFIQWSTYLKNNIVHKGKVHYITFTGGKYHCSQCEGLKLLFIYNYSK